MKFCNDHPHHRPCIACHNCPLCEKWDSKLSTVVNKCNCTREEQWIAYQIRTLAPTEEELAEDEAELALADALALAWEAEQLNR